MIDPVAPEVFAAAQSAAKVIDPLVDGRWCVIGGLANNRWGQPRTTNDADFSVWVEFGEERKLLEQLVARFESRIDDAVEFAIINRVLLLQSESGVGIDLGLCSFPFEEAIIDRATPYAYSNEIKLQTCSAEDLVVMKSIANRGIDWFDIDSLAITMGSRLNWSMINDLMASIRELVEDEEVFTNLKKIQQKHSHG
jgi:hypothetical protein